MLPSAAHTLKWQELCLQEFWKAELCVHSRAFWSMSLWKCCRFSELSHMDLSTRCQEPCCLTMSFSCTYVMEWSRRSHGTMFVLFPSPWPVAPSLLNEHRTRYIVLPKRHKLCRKSMYMCFLCSYFMKVSVLLVRCSRNSTTPNKQSVRTWAKGPAW